MPINFQAGTVSEPATKVIRFTRPLEVVGLSAVLIERATAGVGESVTDRDAYLDQVVSAPQVTDYQIRIETFGGVSPIIPVWSSSDEDKATVDTEGYVTHVSDGAVTVTATINGTGYDIELTMSTDASATTGTLTGYVAGSLAADATIAVDSRLAGKSAASALKIFTTQTHTGSPLYVRNSACWCADVDLTPISPWNSVGGVHRAGTLISPRHVLFAAHYPLVTGSVIRFIAIDGGIIDRTITGRLIHPDYPNAYPYYPDIGIAVLDSDVPPSISFASILPVNYADQLPALLFSRPVPAVCLDQEEKALVTDLGRISPSGSIWATFIAPFGINYEKRLEFYEDKIGGDSGNPAFLILNGELVLLTVWTYGGAGVGTSITAHIDAINTMMTELGGGYQLTTADLSGYNDYS